MTRSLAAIAIASALTLAACGGDSKEDKAQNQVCDAKAEIAKQVDTLQGLTISTATVNQVQQSLKAIGSSLTQIKDAQGDLSDDRKQQVQSANQAFESQVKGILSNLGQSTSVSDAAAQMQSAMKQLASSYKQAYAKVDC
jgi:membrane peptidoglycan carboxypeptidase